MKEEVTRSVNIFISDLKSTSGLPTIENKIFYKFLNALVIKYQAKLRK